MSTPLRSEGLGERWSRWSILRSRSVVAVKRTTMEAAISGEAQAASSWSSPERKLKVTSRASAKGDKICEPSGKPLRSRNSAPGAETQTGADAAGEAETLAGGAAMRDAARRSAATARARILARIG